MPMDASSPPTQRSELQEDMVAAFFKFARDRHLIYLSRARGMPPPWTKNPILRDFRFTNIFRELDRTTAWLREHVRRRYARQTLILPATVLFRWFNKIETGQAIFERQVQTGTASTSPFSHWVAGGGTNLLKQEILRARGAGPYVNGAYIIRSPEGMNKLDGVLHMAEIFRSRRIGGMDWNEATRAMQADRWSLREAWEWLLEFPYQGGFTAYEVVSDMRHTPWLENASDIMTWANAGPGAMRGLNRIMGRPVEQKFPQALACHMMWELLEHSRKQQHWPRGWGVWEMREVEHTLCEFDKMQRVLLGEGVPKQRYRAA